MNYNTDKEIKIDRLILESNLLQINLQRLLSNTFNITILVSSNQKQ